MGAEEKEDVRCGVDNTDPISNNKTQLFPQSSTLQIFNPDPQRSSIHALENAMSIREAWSEHASIDLAFWILPGR